MQQKAPGEFDLLGVVAFRGDVPDGRLARCGRLARLLPRAGPSLYNLSVSADALPPPLARGGFGRPQCFLYLFGELYVIIGLRSNSAHFIGKEVGTMNHIFAFMTSVAANVVSHFVCKWLDGWFKDRKH